MADIESDIDRLYQAPLADFTAERSALAARAGSKAPAIRGLQKPSLPAWAVNQVYWRRRKTFDKLVTASERLRRAHADMLSGKDVDVSLAERAHEAALTTAVGDARTLLEQAGEPASENTLAAVRETLHMLPWTTLVGRLTRPLKRTGLEALSALTTRRSRTANPPAEVVSMRAALERRSSTTAEREAREADTRRRNVQTLSRELNAAKVTEQRAATALAQALKLVERGERERADLESRMERVNTALDGWRRELDAARKAHASALAEREQLQERLADIDT